MTIPAILSQLKDLDIKLWLDGDQLKLNAPKGVVTPELQAEIGANRSAIIAFLKGTEAAASATLPPVTHVDCGDHSPLSFAQQRLWFLDKYEADNTAYTIVKTYELNGPLDFEALERSLSEILRRHSALRTVFRVDCNEQPVQVILPSTPVELPLFDLQAIPAAQRDEEAQRLVTQQSQTPFVLSRGPLFRAALVRLGPQRHWLLALMHHIVADGWSTGVFFNELQTLYQAYAHQQASPLPELAIQYTDYVAWQRQWYAPETLRSKLDYWQQKLKGPLPILELPADLPRPALMTYRGANQRAALSPELLQKIREICNQSQATPFMFLLAAFQILLYRYTGQEDVVIGTPTANRGSVEFEALIGLFVNTLAIRTDLSGNPTFLELLERVRETALQAFAYQDVPFEMIVEALRPARDTTHTPIFQVFFILQNLPSPASQVTDLRFQSVSVDPKTAKFDLTLEIFANEAAVFFGFEYNTDLFEPTTIQRMLGHFRTIVEGICTNPRQGIGELPLLTADERRQMLVNWNDTQIAYPHSQTLQTLFEAQVQRTPTAVAICDEQGQITYDALNRRANRLARYLRQLGVGPEVLVGISLPRSIDMVVSLLAILKGGGAYVPLDPNYPTDRLAYMLKDSGVQVLLTQADLVVKFLPDQVKVVCLDSDEVAFARLSDGPVDSGSQPDNPAYVIYTSGTTGRPKGVVVLQRSLVNFLTAMQRQPGLSAEDILLSVTTLSFDIAGLELYLPLISGARLILVSSATAGDGARLRRSLEQTAATLMQATPATWRLLIAAGWQGSRQFKILCGGEALPPELVPALLERCGALWNMYGPTETTIWSTLCPITSAAEPVTIGRPIANTQVYLLNPWGQPVPVGVPGELYIAGDGVARGYLNRPELTAEKFLLDPFSDHGRLYRTGDLACYQPDGRIRFLGRQDDQVKIHGVRIELREITATLLDHPQVKSAVTVGWKKETDHPYLAAYLVAAPEASLGADELRSFLSERLPTAMIPAYYVFLNQLPLTPNGKVDLRALPEPTSLPAPPSDFIPPHDAVEAKLILIWKKLLRVNHLGIHDDFFQLGGHSMLAVQMFSQIQETFGVNLPLTSLFHKANVQYLASLITQQRGPTPWSSLVAIRPSGNRQPLFCVHGLTGDVMWFGRLVSHMDLDQPVWGLQAQGQDGIQPPLTSIEEMAALYIKEMRGLQPEGPYYFCGYSLGGSVAFEMARQLQRQGQKVGLVALIDHASPKSGYYTVKLNWAFIKNFAESFPYRLVDVLRLRPKTLLGRLYHVLQATKKALIQRLRSKQRIEPTASDLLYNAGRLPLPMQNIIEANYKAINNYFPAYYDGVVTLLRARGGRLFVSPDPEMCWGKYASKVVVRMISGSHLSLFDEKHVWRLSEQLQACLDEAQAGQEA